MERAVVVRFTCSVDDLLEGYRYHYRQLCRPIFRLGLHFIFGIILLGGILGCLAESGSSLVLPGACIIVGVYWFAIRPFERRWMIRRQYAKRPDKDRELEWEFSPDKISARSPLGESEFNWEGILKAVRTPSGLMLYPLEQLFYYLPRRGFANDMEFQQVADLAQNRARRYHCVA